MTDDLAADEPVPVAVHDAAMPAQLDIVRLADAEIPARLVEPDGPVAGEPLSAGRPGGRRAVVVVRAADVEAARAVLAEPPPMEDAPDSVEDGDAAAVLGDRPDAPVSPRSLPILVGAGLVVAVILLVIGVLGWLGAALLGP